MAWTFVMAALLAAGPTETSTAPVAEIRWLQRAGTEGHEAGELLPPSPDAPDGALRVRAPEELEPVTLATLEAPGITGQRWRAEGRIRYRDVGGEGYLVLLSQVGGDEYFTKSLAPSGPLGLLRGSSEWRRFVLPFDAKGKGPPENLTLQVVLPAGGTVDIGRVGIYEGFDPALVEGLGFASRLGFNAATLTMAAGLVGAVLSFLAVFGGLAKLTGQAAERGPLLAALGMAIGTIAALAGLLATIAGQAGGWLLAVGIMGVVVMAGLRQAFLRGLRPR